MRNFTLITVLLLCCLSWISVSGSEFQTVEVQPGEDVTMLCSNYSSVPTQITWYKLVKRTQPHCVSSMFRSTDPAKYCDGFKSGKFEMSSNVYTLFLKIKQVDLSDSGLYFCGFYITKNLVIVDATFLEVQEGFDGLTKLILGGLTVFLAMVVICLAVKIKKLQKELFDSSLQNLDSNDLKDAALSLYLTTIRNRRPESERQVETRVIYAASR
uniref:Ig-like domain-containing protein n=1 Tax=Dicentrarchus labrax TaxID=13489 RepID=A0A8C4IW14_DICLA